LQAKIEMLHEAVSRGQLGDMETLLQEEKSKRMALCKDSAGVPLLQKAMYYNHLDIVKWLVETYPITVSTKDRVSTCSVTNQCVIYCFLCVFLLPSRDSVDGLDDRASVVRFLAQANPYIFSKQSKPALRHIHPPAQWIL
jgi:hypothetical protein